MWNESVPANLEKLRTGVRTRTQLADVFLSSIRYLFQTEVHAYAFSIAANAYLSFFPFNLILLVVCQRWLHWESAYLMVLQLCAYTSSRVGIINSKFGGGGSRAATVAVGVRVHAPLHQFGGVPTT